MTEAIPVLLYHSIPSRAYASRGGLSVSHALFSAHLRAILASRRTPVSIGELAQGLRGELALPERCVALTFDDGYSNTLRAVRELCEHGLRASVFLTSGEIGLPGMIAQEDVRALAGLESMVQLGAHSVTHPRLDELDVQSLEQEIQASRAALEAITGRAIDSFAYPFGSYDRRVRRAVAKAGFQSAAAVKNALSHPGDDPLAIARYTVTGATTTSELEALLDGQGAPLAWRHERIRTAGYRTARRLTRRVRAGERTAR